MLSIGKYFDCWYLIVAFEYPWKLHILLVSPCASIHVLTSDASLFQSPIRMICSPWCIHSDISLLGSIQNWVLWSFWIFSIDRAYSCWLYSPYALALSVGKYAVIILVTILFFPLNNIHDQRPRFLNSWPVTIDLHDILSTARIAVPLLWNSPLEMVTLLYHILILLVLNHPYLLLYVVVVVVGLATGITKLVHYRVVCSNTPDLGLADP